MSEAEEIRAKTFEEAMAIVSAVANYAGRHSK